MFIMQAEDAIKECLRVSGKILMESFGKLKEYTVKHNQSNIVTQADLDSEKAIVQIIEKRFPEHSIIAEETGFRDKKSEYVWIIDPLDGTSNFSAGIPWFGVIVALLKSWEPVAAGVFLPFYNVTYLAEKGKGATRNGEKISVSGESELKNVLLAYSLDFSSDFSKTEMESRIIAGLVRNIRNLRATNSVVDFCYTADGKLGGCINQAEKIWDLAAPWLIIKEAGGIVTDIHGEQIDFSAGSSDYSRNFTSVASSKPLHGKILEIINKAKC